MDIDLHATMIQYFKLKQNIQYLRLTYETKVKMIDIDITESELTECGITRKLIEQNCYRQFIKQLKELS